MKWIVAAVAIALVWWLLRRPKAIAMSTDEAAARRTLGVGPRAGNKAIRAAHRRLVAEAHPDRGGSDEAARRLNAARDLLLSRTGRTEA